MSWFSDNGIDESGGELQLPGQQPGQYGTQGAPAAPAAAPQAGQFANSQQGFLDWATQKYGQDPTRGGGFVNAAAGGGLQNMGQQYAAATGNTANFMGGPSGDRMDFGQGVSDALTSGGQIWNPGAGGGAGGGMASMPGPMFNSRSSSSGGGQMANMAMPTAPTAKDIATPDPFSYQGIGNLANTPQMQQQSYNPAATPTPLNYQNLATPEGYKAEAYQGLTKAQLEADPSYRFRLKAGQDAQENILAHSGALRTGNAAQALSDYGQQSASQEYAAADARARQTNQMNNATSLGAYQTNAQTGLAYNQNANQNALNFGNTNYNQAFQTNQANNQGSNAAIAANNQSALAQNQQGLAAQQQGYTQAAGTYGMNAGNALAFGQANNQNALANYQAQTNAALGVGNLNLGYTQAANQYSLGQGNQALAAQGQAFNQAGQTYDRNYQANVTDPWNQTMGLANLGNPGAPNSQGYGQQQGDIYSQIGNVNAAGQIGAANAQQGALGNIGNMAGNALAYQQWLNSQKAAGT